MEEVLERLDAKALKTIIEDLHEVPDKSSKKEVLVEQATGLIMQAGLETFFSRFEVPFLKELLTARKLKCNTENKDVIIHALINGTDATVVKSKKVEKAPQISKEKPDLAPGISYEDLFQWYYAEELVAFCKEEGLKVTGKF